MKKLIVFSAIIATSLIATKGYSQVYVSAHVGFRGPRAFVAPAPRVYVAPRPVVYANAYAPAPVVYQDAYIGGPEVVCEAKFPRLSLL